MFRHARVLGIIVLMSACVDGIFQPKGARPYEPPPIYAQWWKEIEDCSERRGNMQAVTFLTVPDAVADDSVISFACPQRPDGCGGYWRPGLIYIATGLELYRPVVAHEMLHEVTASAAHGPAFDQCRLRR